MRIRNIQIPTIIREDIDILSIIIAMALILRLYFAFIVEFSPNPDVMVELKAFDGIALGGGWDVHRPPLYPLFLRAIYAFSGASNYRAVFAVQAVLSTAVVVLMYVAGRLLLNRGAGLIAAAISAIHPNFMIYNLTISPDSIAMIIVVSIMAAALIEMREKRRAWVSAALIGVGVLVKPLLVYLLPGMLLTTRKRVLFIIVTAAILAPWTIRNSVVRRKFTPVYHKAAYEIDLRKYKARYETWGTVHKLYYNASTVLRKGWSGSISDESGQKRNSNYLAAYTYLAIMVGGLIGLTRYYRKDHRAFVWPILWYIVLLIFLSNFEIGYRIHFEPLLIAYCAILLAQSGDYVAKKIQGLRSRRRGPAAPA